jgi:outer membrane protein assembly factor BamD
VLGANYPGTDWYGHAYKLMQEHPPKAVAPIPPGQPIIPVGTPGAQAPSLPGESGTATPKAEAPGAPTPVAPSGGTTGGPVPSTETPTT